ncbi:MAG: hypothetical protein EKK43_08965 [Methylobacterium sp.]|nr:MAG: hypothetical protein EKK43_08965 [Methylobacterium sp.]
MLYKMPRIALRLRLRERTQMSKRRREIEQLEAEIAAMEQQVQQIASKRAVAVLRMRTLEAMEFFETAAVPHQERQGHLPLIPINGDMRGGPSEQRSRPIKGKNTTTAPTDKKRLVDRDKLAELTRQLCPARQKAVLLVVEMIEAAYPSSVTSAEINSRFAEDGTVSISVLAKCKTALHRSQLVSFSRVDQRWSIKGAPTDSESPGLAIVPA